jgi:hypothetical protein
METTESLHERIEVPGGHPFARLRCGAIGVSTYNIYLSPDHPSPKRRGIP